MLKVDALIVGAGTAGLATALALARAGQRVIAIDRRPQETGFAIGESLSPSARPVLAKLGLWAAFLQTGPLPSPGNRSAWATPELNRSRFLSQPGGRGWHIDRVVFDHMLATQASDAGALIHRPKQLVTLERQGSGWCATIAGPDPNTQQLVQAPTLIDATGRAAAIARRLGARRHVVDNLIAWGSYGQPVPSHSDSADAGSWVEATPTGWWYTARIPRERMVVARMSAPEARLRSFAPDLATAPTYTRARLSDHLPGSFQNWRRWAAGSQRISPSAGPGWFAVGDAAAAYDPISSHGIASGLADAVRVAEAIASPAVDAWQTFDEVTYRRFERYLIDRSYVYGTVTRFRDNRFWRERAGPSTQSAS